MCRQYSQEHIQNEFARWCAGEIGTKTMTKKQYNALKKRCSRAGLRKRPCNFQLSKKLSPDAYIAARKRYQRQWRKQQRSNNEPDL
jgi:hypothetical protein